MSKMLDLTDKIFDNTLRVLGRDLERTVTNSGKPYFVVKCICGNVFSARVDSLRNWTFGCKCNPIEVPFTRNLIGETYGNIVILKYDENKYYNGDGEWWIYKCTCGGTSSIPGYYLKIHNTIEGCPNCGVYNLYENLRRKSPDLEVAMYIIAMKELEY